MKSLKFATMKALKYFSVLYVLTALSRQAEALNILEKFVRSKVDMYSAWIQENQLNPSPIVPGPTEINHSGLFVNLECILSNHNVLGHSDISVESVKADFTSINVIFEMYNVTFQGRYFGSGNAWQDVPFHGEGDWLLYFPLIVANFTLNYSVSNSGFVVITSYDLDGLTLPDNYFDNGGNIQFENFWLNESISLYEEDIKQGVYTAFNKYLLTDKQHPLKQTYLQYFQQLFQVIRWVDIWVPVRSHLNVSATEKFRLNEDPSPRVASQNVLEIFVEDKINSYPTWIRDKNLDPSPPITGPTNLNLGIYNSVWMDCYISDYIVQGHSGDLETGPNRTVQVKADLDGVTVSFGIQSTLTFSGMYKANGTIWMETGGGYELPFSGEGAWNISLSGISFSNLKFNYSIANSGHVFITSYDFRNSNYLGGRISDIYFENLWEDEDVSRFEDDIKGSIWYGFENYIRTDQQHQLHQIYLKYLHQIFMDTTWEEIVVPDPTKFI